MTKRDSSELDTDTAIDPAEKHDITEKDVVFVPSADQGSKEWIVAHGDRATKVEPTEDGQSVADFYNATPMTYCYWYKDKDGKEHSLKIQSNCDTRMLGGTVINENMSTKYNMIRVRDKFELHNMPANDLIKDKILIVRPDVGRHLKSKETRDLPCVRVVSGAMEDDDYFRLTLAAGISKFHVWI